MTELEDKETDSLELGFFVQDLKVLAQYYIQLFFSDKVTLDGKPVSVEFMCDSVRIDRILNLDICSGIDLIYDAVGVNYSKDEMKGYERKGHLPDDVKYVLGLYNQCSKLGIPKCFATGIIIMYLELCRGQVIK